MVQLLLGGRVRDLAEIVERLMRHVQDLADTVAVLAQEVRSPPHTPPLPPPSREAGSAQSDETTGDAVTDTSLALPSSSLRIDMAEIGMVPTLPPLDPPHPEETPYHPRIGSASPAADQSSALKARPKWRKTPVGGERAPIGRRPGGGGSSGGGSNQGGRGRGSKKGEGEGEGFGGVGGREGGGGVGEPGPPDHPDRVIPFEGFVKSKGAHQVSKSREVDVQISDEAWLKGEPEFPTRCSAGNWRLEGKYLAELMRRYPMGWLAREVAKSWMWLVSNPGKKKTARGMTRYLNSWLERGWAKRGRYADDGEPWTEV